MLIIYVTLQDLAFHLRGNHNVALVVHVVVVRYVLQRENQNFQKKKERVAKIK